MPPVITATDEYLVVNSVPLATAACRILDLNPLSDAVPLRGRNRIIPGADGRLAIRRRPDEFVVTLAAVVNGAFGDDGEPNSNPRQGLRDYLRYLGGALGQGSATDESQVVTDWYQPDGTLYRTDAQWAGPYGARRVGPYVVRTTFDVVIPSGVWTEVP